MIKSFNKNLQYRSLHGDLILNPTKHEVPKYIIVKVITIQKDGVEICTFLHKGSDNISLRLL